VLHAALPEDDDRFQTELTALEVDLSFAGRVPTVPKVWILNSPEGRRIVGTAPVGDTELESAAPNIDEGEQTAVPAEFLAGLGGLLLSSPTSATGGISSSTRVGVDPHQLPLRAEGSAYLRRVLPAGAALLPSRVHLTPLGGDPRQAAKRLAREFGVPVVARLDVQGILAIGNDAAWRITDGAVRVEETTGAGDASAAAIVAALARGADLPTAAMLGASIARIALSGWGPEALVRASPIDTPFDRIHATQEDIS
jgi:sugar/nucleoside kinase (ribokinase family)